MARWVLKHFCHQCSCARFWKRWTLHLRPLLAKLKYRCRARILCKLWGCNSKNEERRRGGMAANRLRHQSRHKHWECQRGSRPVQRCLLWPDLEEFSRFNSRQNERSQVYWVHWRSLWYNPAPLPQGIYLKLESSLHFPGFSAVRYAQRQQ